MTQRSDKTELAKLQLPWERLGKEDPLWAVLTDPGKRGNRWDTAAFFATGRGVVDSEMKHLESLGLRVRRRSALDFGCGVGRLTQALADHFEHVYGVDIAASMIAKANELNRNADRCEFVHNPHETLSGFTDGSIDLVLSHLVLQHAPPSLAFGYISEFLRILAPDGAIIFGLPTKPLATLGGILMRLTPALAANAFRRAWFGFEMHGTRRQDVESRINAAGGMVVSCRQEVTGHWRYCVYTVVRKATVAL